MLGATGSIGRSALDVVQRHPECFRAVALTANTDVAGMHQLCRMHAPDYAVMADAGAAARLRQSTRKDLPGLHVLCGQQGLLQVASLAEVDSVVAAIVGGAGLQPTLTAVRAGKRVVLANKEALVMAGRLFMREVEQSGAVLLPVDSEHNAVFQCMPQSRPQAGVSAGGGIRRILLTASGGPFLGRPVSTLAAVSPAEACAHPNWDMGPKISVDSATMMNKGLEIIEACWLFDTVPQRIDVVVHPQSIVHSMVEYVDGSVLAQLGNPDMRTPIAHALAWPQRLSSGVRPLDLVDVGRLEFLRPDAEQIACLDLARGAIATGGTAPTVLNAANEVAVQAFLDSMLRFTDIRPVIERCMAQMEVCEAEDLEVVLWSDQMARRAAMALVREISEVARR